MLGIETPHALRNREPVTFALKDTEPLAEVLQVGAHFTGTIKIPSINCGLSGMLLGPVLTAVMSGPENTYDLHIRPVEPPTLNDPRSSVAATGVTQISAKLSAAWIRTANR